MDKVQENVWFASSLIRTMSAVGIPTLIAFAIWEWYHEDPIVDVRLLKNRNFGTAVFFSFILGVVLFGSTVLIPEFLQSSLGYTAERAGMALSPGGLALMVMMPIAGRLTGTKLDPRILVATGFLGLGLTLHMMTVIYLGMDFHTIVWLRIIQVLPMPLIFVPISTLNYIGVPRNKNNQVSGMSNFARNMGGAIGTSLLGTFLTRQNQTHLQEFARHTSPANAAFERTLHGLQALFLSRGLSQTVAMKRALATTYQILLAQAGQLGFENAFWIMSAIVLCLVPLPFIMRRPRPGEGRGETAPAH
jgi:DHA2 family multidrug resistance protein